MTTSTSAKTCLASMSTSHVHRSGMTYPTLGEAERSTTFPATPVRWHLTVRNIQICSRKMTPQPWKHLKAFCRKGIGACLRGRWVTVGVASALPQTLGAGDRAYVEATLLPNCLAASYFPSERLAHVGASPVGSRTDVDTNVTKMKDAQIKRGGARGNRGEHEGKPVNRVRR